MPPASQSLLDHPPRFTQRTPRFNHVAMSLPAALLNAEHRRQIVDFYSRVFGFQHYDMMDEDGQRLVMGAYSAEQFLFLLADERPMTCPRLDHFGMSVASEAELDDLLARCRAYQRLDDRVEIIDKQTEDFGAIKLVSFYARFLLPMMIEVQYFHYADGRADAVA